MSFEDNREDAISREAFIKKYDEWTYSEYGHHAREDSLAIRVIKSLPSVTQKSGKWISVSEKLPEDGQWCLFTDGNHISVERYKMDALDHFYPNGRWFDFNDALAWMPLPKPYEPQESEDKE